MASGYDTSKWPEMPDDCRRASWGIAKKWVRSFPTLADDIFQEARLASWLAIMRPPPAGIALKAHVTRHVVWALRRFVGEQMFWSYSRPDRRIKRLEVRVDNIEGFSEKLDQPDDEGLSYLWERLTARQALAVHFRVVCGLSFTEAAFQMGCHRSAFVSCYRKAIAKLRRIIEGM